MSAAESSVAVQACTGFDQGWWVHCRLKHQAVRRRPQQRQLLSKRSGRRAKSFPLLHLLTRRHSVCKLNEQQHRQQLMS